MKYKPTPEAIAEKNILTAEHNKMIAGIKTFTIQEKALCLLDDVCGTLYYDRELPEELTNNQKNEIINRVYFYAHGANAKNLCFSAHEDWRKKIERDFKCLVNHKPIIERP